MQLKWKSKEQRFKDKQNKRDEEYSKLEHWRTKFAWLPVRLSATELLWLEKYEYRGDRSKYTHGWAFSHERRRPLKPINWHVQEQETSRARS